MADQTQIAELSKELMISMEQYKFAERQKQLTANQLNKTKVVIDEVNKAKEDTKMYRSLGRLFIDCPKPQILKELNENATTLTSETEKYAEMSKNYKDK